MNFRFVCYCVSLWMMIVANLSGQTLVDLRSQAKNVDFSAAMATKPIKTGMGLPAACTAGELYFDLSASPGSDIFTCDTANTWTAIGRRIPSTTVAGLPATCAVGDLYYVTDASFADGGWRLYTCTSANIWSQAGVQSDGSGYLTVTCVEPSNCLVGPNTAVLASLPGPNVWTGASDFSGASKTAMFRLASTAPSTCDAVSREAYFDTASNSVSICSSANTWTPIGGSGGSFLLYQKTGVSPITADGTTQTLDSFVIPAGKLRVGDLIEIRANFSRTGSAGPIVFGVSFGDTAIESISTAASLSATSYALALTVAGPASQIWDGTVFGNGVFPVTLSASANPSASIASAITVALTQNGTGLDAGSVTSWSVKVTR